METPCIGVRLRSESLPIKQPPCLRHGPRSRPKKAASVFWEGHQQVGEICAYIDGFNLYHGALEFTTRKWLDLNALCMRLAGNQPIKKIVYSTAMVAGDSADPNKPIRQQLYHRALASLPNVRILLGNFQEHDVRRPLGTCDGTDLCFTTVRDRKEKGSDVNLATHLLHDAHRDVFDSALVITGDSDLVEPIRLVVQELKRQVHVFNPRNRVSKELRKVASSCGVIWESAIKQCQFPDVIGDVVTGIAKPAEWSVVKPKTIRKMMLDSPCGKCKSAYKSWQYHLPTSSPAAVP